jgi:putative N6-adenine-specific DNA methylase
VTNPPYGERISTSNLLETYKMIGERLKHAFKEGDAWILSYKEECFNQIGLKPSVKIPLYNGSLECEYRKYSIFGGKLKEFREEGGVVKTEEEKRRMAEKRKSWHKKEFDKKQEDKVNNEEADILTFKFRSLEKSRREKFDRKPRRNNDGDEPREQRGFRGGEGFRGDRKRRDGEGFRGDSRKGDEGYRGGDGRRNNDGYKGRKGSKPSTREERQQMRKKFFGKRDSSDNDE